ncbi:hypothetical protein BamMC406_6781 (plasmid) [Burkholderia ambifaria MC40-6]|uniref:Uncharacterized protein n=1 Tax=Burkholderia ambifaria (strain MC40-6) TaxID=398577 RepID=B1Z6V4_BURA4|nr:hypothetical protein [Burkholderia ambifaria]ACB69181.1 hypothetical protein BamMC406_6781 [Burkholderia ambifaria MC40-6]
MFKKRVQLISLTILASAALPLTAYAYPPDLFAVNELHFDSYRQACGLDCILEQRSVQDVATSIAAGMGINPAYVKVGLKMAFPQSRIEGEDTYYEVKYPPGYRYCSASINIISIMSASADPDRGTMVAASAQATLLSIYTWTGDPHPGEGQSSAEGWAKVTSIRREYYEEFKNKGVCSSKGETESREFMRCRGHDCREAHEGGNEVAGKAVPALKNAPDGF